MGLRFGDQAAESGDWTQAADDAIKYFLLAETFGWTKRQIDSESAFFIDQMLATRDEVLQFRNEQSGK